MHMSVQPCSTLVVWTQAVLICCLSFELVMIITANIIIIITIITLIRMTMRGSCLECIAGANLLLKPLLTPARATWSTSVLIIIITIIIMIAFATIVKNVILERPLCKGCPIQMIQVICKNKSFLSYCHIDL